MPVQLLQMDALQRQEEQTCICTMMGSRQSFCVMSLGLTAYLKRTAGAEEVLRCRSGCSYSYTRHPLNKLCSLHKVRTICKLASRQQLLAAL
jgi:hypothetical protein